MTVDQLPLPTRAPGQATSGREMWRAFGPSRVYRRETVAELWDNCRKNYPGRRLDINQRTRDALAAAGKPLDGAHVNDIVPFGQVWIHLGETA